MNIIMTLKFAHDIFRKKCCILKQDRMKRPGVEDRIIEALCNRTVKLLKAWDQSHHNTKEQAPTEELKERAKRQLELSITPKVHMMEDCVWDQLNSISNGLAYVVEDFVEKNHQNEFKIEDQTKKTRNQQM